jgi:ribosomal protein S12 methylthiotransferase
VTAPPAAPALAFVTLGCPKNTVDSEKMLGLLCEAGFRTVADPRDADIAVVNTCAFLQSAVRESKAAIEELARERREGGLRGLIVAGCLAQREGASLLDEFPEVDAVLGTGQWRGVVAAASHLLSDSPERFARTEYPGGALDALGPRALSTPRHLAYLKISEGCDHRCTFCIIPRLRGDQQSRPLVEIVAEAERLAAAGVKELNLIGQDTTGWGTDLPGKPELADLLLALDQVEGITWVRVHYTYPRLWSDRLIETWAAAKRVIPYVDMPLQHIADDMLRTMARGMTGRATRELVRRIKSGIPGVAFRTNFIVGFPGETEAHFDELCRYVEEEPFENLVVFSYEREPETPSYHMTPRVHVARRRSRRARLLALQQRLSAARMARRVGSVVTAMIDGRTEDAGGFAGRTAGSSWEVDGGVRIDDEGASSLGPKPGALARVRVLGSTPYDLFGRFEAAADSALTLIGDRI